jgi:hypothetical protein
VGKLFLQLSVVLQTYGRSGRYNPHLHAIVTNGGMDEEKKEWKELRYLPFDMLHKTWQEFLLEMMKNEIKTYEMVYSSSPE